MQKTTGFFGLKGTCRRGKPLFNVRSAGLHMTVFSNLGTVQPILELCFRHQQHSLKAEPRIPDSTMRVQLTSRNAMGAGHAISLRSHSAPQPTLKWPSSYQPNGHESDVKYKAYKWSAKRMSNLNAPLPSTMLMVAHIPTISDVSGPYLTTSPCPPLEAALGGVGLV